MTATTTLAEIFSVASGSAKDAPRVNQTPWERESEELWLPGHQHDCEADWHRPMRQPLRSKPLIFTFIDRSAPAFRAMDLVGKLADSLRRLRERSGLTQTEMARRLG